MDRPGVKELIATACWYLWWQRRQIAHDENVATLSRSALAISAITSNYSRASKIISSRERRDAWEKTKEGYTKLIVDASFIIGQYRAQLEL